MLEGRPHTCLPAAYRLLGLLLSRFTISELRRSLFFAALESITVEESPRECPPPCSQTLSFSLLSPSFYAKSAPSFLALQSSPGGLRRKTGTRVPDFFGGAQLGFPRPSSFWPAGRRAVREEGRRRPTEARRSLSRRSRRPASRVCSGGRCDGRMGEGIAVQLRRVGEYRGLRNARALLP